MLSFYILPLLCLTTSSFGLSEDSYKHIINFKKMYEDRFHITLVNTTKAQSQMFKLRERLTKGGVRVGPQVVHPFTGIYTFTAQLRGGVLNMVRSEPYVYHVEPVRPIAFDTSSKTGTKKGNLTCHKQTDAHWGLKRISGRAGISDKFKYNRSGRNATIYIIDTGVKVDHKEFGERATFGTCVPPSVDPRRPMTDHGTHVAAIAAGRSTGVAKKANIVSVRISDDEFYSDTEHLQEGLMWILSDHMRRARHANRLNYLKLEDVEHVLGYHPPHYIRPKSVINISMSTKATVAVDILIHRLIQHGVVVVSSAGNDMTDACSSSPGGLLDVITVACSDAGDNMCDESNFGPCVDLFAPGHDIYSASGEATNSYVVKHGTSMSAPFVSGVIAAYMSSFKSAPSPERVSKWLRATATANRIGLPYEALDTPNLLVYSGCGRSVYNHSYAMLGSPVAANPVYLEVFGFVAVCFCIVTSEIANRIYQN